MKIKTKASFQGNEPYNFPLGSVDRNCIHIGSITLNRLGGSGQITEAQAKAMLADAIQAGAEVVIKFDNVEIILS